jgi:hypothetical protein
MSKKLLCFTTSNGLFRQFRNASKSAYRYIRSLYWLVRLKWRNNGVEVGCEIRDKLGTFEDVHIICPGPSVQTLEEAILPASSLVIFVNHAVALQACPSLAAVQKVSFSSDPIRAAELVESRGQDLRSCISVLTPGHLFQLSDPVYEQYDYIYTPFTCFSKKYGIVGGAVNDAALVEPPYNTFTGYGFGSLPAAIIFSLIFAPKRIHFFGCDLRSVAGKDYGISNVPRLAKTPYDKIRIDVDFLQKSFFERGIEFIWH